MTPSRTCVGCRKARPADVLFRVVRQSDGQLTVDRKAPGRGAWLCRRAPDCFRAAIRRHAFERAFGAPVETIAIEQLRARVERAEKQTAPDVRG